MLKFRFSNRNQNEEAELPRFACLWCFQLNLSLTFGSKYRKMPIVDERRGQEGYLDGSHFVSCLLKTIVAS